VSKSNNTQPSQILTNVLPGLHSTTTQWEWGVLTVCALKNFGNIVICNEKLYLQMGHCVTYNSSFSDEQESKAILFGACPHVYYSTIIHHGYIALLRNTSDLNDLFCAPLNRHELLYRDCSDGFSPSIISIDY